MQFLNINIVLKEANAYDVENSREIVEVRSDDPDKHINQFSRFLKNDRVTLASKYLPLDESEYPTEGIKKMIKI